MGRYKHLRARTYFSVPLTRKDYFQRLPYAADIVCDECKWIIATLHVPSSRAPD
jgi:hypothetical protein